MDVKKAKVLQLEFFYAQAMVFLNGWISIKNWSDFTHGTRDYTTLSLAVMGTLFAALCAAMAWKISRERHFLGE